MDNDDSIEEEGASPTPASEIAQEVKQLQGAINETLEKRERVPQPMFWYLLHERIAEIKKRRAMQRTVDELLGG